MLKIAVKKEVVIVFKVLQYNQIVLFYYFTLSSVTPVLCLFSRRNLQASIISGFPSLVINLLDTKLPAWSPVPWLTKLTNQKCTGICSGSFTLIANQTKVNIMNGRDAPCLFVFGVRLKQLFFFI